MKRSGERENTMTRWAVGRLLVILLFSVATWQFFSSYAEATNLVLFEDDFNRPDSSSLGAPWTEANETTPGQDPGFIELNGNALAFHYVRNSHGSSQNQPHAFAPLDAAVSSALIATMNFTYSPHSNGRVAHQVGLMSATAGFSTIFDGALRPVVTPNDGIGVRLGRTDRTLNNSSIGIFRNDVNVGGKLLAFQLDPGTQYSVSLSISATSTTVVVSDGILTDSISVAVAPPLTMDQVFVTDIQGGISFADGLGEHILRFDDFLVQDSLQVQVVQIDIKPGTFPNSINPRSPGLIPVAILSTDTLDATTVDPSTVRFGAAGTEAAPAHFALEDVNGDGKPDVVLQFATQSTGIVCGGTSASLTGKTVGDQAISGSDSIRTVSCH